MARYAEQVVAPLVEQEAGRCDAAARKLFRRAKSVLTRDEKLVDAAGRAQIEALTGLSPVLKVIYEKRRELQRVWAKRGGDAEAMLAEFRQWCHDAEATGIQALRDFVEELRSYTVPRLQGA
jgi:hypothetical protein